MSDSFAGIDFSQYQGWQQLKSPSGETYYVVPGTGYVYDPFLSAAKGRPVLLQNNYAQYQQQNQDQSASKQQAIDLQKAQIAASNPINQILPIGATVGGLWAAKQLANGGIFGGSGSGTAATGLKTSTAAGNPTSGAAVANDAAAATPTGGTLGAAAAAAGAEPWAGAGLAADPASAFAGASAGADAGAVNAGMAADPGLFGSLGGAGATAGMLGLGAAAAYNWYKNDGGAAILGGGGKRADYANTLLDSNPVTGWINPLGNILGFGNVGNRLFGASKTTRQIAADHTNDLMAQNPDDPAWQQYVGANRQQFSAGPPDPSHPFGDTHGNTFANWNDYESHGLDPANLTGVYGNLHTYGNQWASLTEAQRQAVTQKNIADGIYKPDHGEVVITDPDKAQANFNSVINPQPQGQQLTAGTKFGQPQTVGKDGKIKPL
jgi:hypothetical protein